MGPRVRAQRLRSKSQELKGQGQRVWLGFTENSPFCRSHYWTSSPIRVRVTVTVTVRVRVTLMVTVTVTVTVTVRVNVSL